MSRMALRGTMHGRNGTMLRSVSFAVALLCALCFAPLVARAASIPVIRIGAAATVTGTFRSLYLGQNASWSMWLGYIEAQGGISVGGVKHRVEMIVEDVHDSFQGTLDASEKLVNVHNCTILFAPYGSTYTPAAATVGEKYAIPVISGDSAAEAVFTNETTGRRRFEYLVGLNSPAQRYFGDFIDLMSLQGVKTVGIIAEDASFPAGTALGTIYSAADRAMEVVAQVKIPRITELTPEATATLRAALETLRDSGAEAVVSSVYYHACLGLVQQAKLMGYMPKAWALSVCIGMEELEEELGPDLNYLYGPSQWDYRLKGRSYIESGFTLVQHFNHENLTAPRAFWEEYQKHTGTKPTYQAAGSMAQCYALQAALMITDSLEGSDIMRALMSLYESSFYGRISFSFNGQDIVKHMVVYQYRALGMEPFERLHEAEYRVEIVTPLSAATSAPVFPAPGWDEREYRRRIYASPREQAVAAITGILMLATLVLSVLFVLNRNAVIVKASNHVFCQLMFLAGEILYMAVLVWPIDASDLTCKAFPWLFCVGMMLFLACLVAKNYRICKILHQRFRRVRIRVRQLLTVVFGICLVQVLLLLLWYAVGAPTDMLVVVDPVRPVFNYHDCDSSTDDSEPVTFIIGAYSFIIGLTAVVIAFMSRKAPSEYNESRTIALATYNSVLGGVLFLGLASSPVASEPALRETWYVVRSGLALVVISGTLGAVFVPKLVWLAMELRGVDIKAVSAHGGDSHNGVARGGGRKVARRSKSENSAHRHRREQPARSKQVKIPQEMSDVELGPPKNKSKAALHAKPAAKRTAQPVNDQAAPGATAANGARAGVTTDVVNPLNQ